MGSETTVDYGLGDAEFEAALAAVDDLEVLGRLARGCTRCALRRTCRGVVFGEGDAHAEVVLIGEGPGATEDELGRPFVGRAGELLDQALQAAGFSRSAVYISNVVLCRPPGNRTPTPEEVRACSPYLRRRLELIAPPIVVALGATAAAALLRPGTRITQARGRWHRVGGRWVMPTYHPAAVLRDPSKRPDLWADLRQVRELWERLQALRGRAG